MAEPIATPFDMMYNSQEITFDYEAVALAVCDILDSTMRVRDYGGVYCGNQFVTPYECYSLIQFLTPVASKGWAKESLMINLAKGTNHPLEMVQKVKNLYQSK